MILEVKRPVWTVQNAFVSYLYIGYSLKYFCWSVTCFFDLKSKISLHYFVEQIMCMYTYECALGV